MIYVYQSLQTGVAVGVGVVVGMQHVGTSLGRQKWSQNICGEAMACPTNSRDAIMVAMDTLKCCMSCLVFCSVDDLHLLILPFFYTILT